MPKVTYVHPNGAREVLDVPLGTSVMRAAIINSIDGIVAECGGEMMCATCHVYVDAAWLDRTGLPEPGSQEETMLSFAAAAQPNSRLTCQIRMCEELAGIVLRMPEGQH